MKWTEAAALDALAAFVLREDRLPSRADWGAANQLPNYQTIRRLFGTERAAITALVTRALRGA